MTTTTIEVTGGVDTHRDTHHAAALDQVGRLLGTREFPAEPAGYQQLLAWLESFGTLTRIGVEGTGCYGAGLTRFLRRRRLRVIEVNRPDRRSRRLRGKSDPLDAESAARRALAGEDRVIPKDTTTIVEAIRVLRIARSGAVKSRTAGLQPAQGSDRHRTRRTPPVAARQVPAAGRGRVRPTATRPDPAGRSDPRHQARPAQHRRPDRRTQQRDRSNRGEPIPSMAGGPPGQGAALGSLTLPSLMPGSVKNQPKQVSTISRRRVAHQPKRIVKHHPEQYIRRCGVGGTRTRDRGVMS